MIQTLSGKEDIGDFMTALDMDKWKLGKLPSGAEEIGSFDLSQEETVKFGQTGTDGELYDVCKFSEPLNMAEIEKLMGAQDS